MLKQAIHLAEKTFMLKGPRIALNIQEIPPLPLP